MPYDANFEILFKNAIESDEIKNGVQDADLDRDFFFSHSLTILKEKSDRILEAGIREIEEFNNLENTIKNLRYELSNLEGTYPKWVSNIEKGLKFIREPKLILIFLSIIISIVYFIIGFNNIITYILHILFYVNSIDFNTKIVITTILIGLSPPLIKIYEKYNNNKEPIALLRRKLIEANARIELIKQDADNAVTIKGIFPELRLIIDDLKITSKYEIMLKRLNAPGLAEVFNPSYEVLTDSKEKLSILLEKMPGGSIGIAGPRGSGKSTLLWSFCGEGLLRKIKDRPVLSITTSAPVEYEARDFILHLFSLICNQILNLKIDNIQNYLSSLNKNNSQYSPVDSIFSAMISFKNAILSLFLGMLFVSGGIFIISRINSSDLQLKDLDSLEIKPGYFLILGFIFLITSFFILNLYEFNSKFKNKSNNSDKLYQNVNIFSIDMISLCIFLVGAVFICITIYTSYVKASPDLRMLVIDKYIAFLGISQQNLLILGIIFVVLGFATSGIYNKRRDYLFEHIKADEDTLEGAAKAWLKKIRFQQSYSSGWSGTLSLPIGFEGSVNAAESIAENQLSLPEIVSGYRNFLKNVSKEYEIIVGIDELDKLQSDENAQRFLNEIKSIFGLDHVFYLVSVSENAMSSFERRGLPFRDTFDSSFDKIIYVDYLSLEKAKQLIKRRVIGMPIPFLCLGYCLSGGLARDLIRICRDMLEQVETKKSDMDLSTVCGSLIESDLKAKIKAVSIAAKNIHLETEISDLFEDLRKIELSIGSPSSLLKIALELNNEECKLGPKAGISDEIMDRHEKLASLKQELIIFIYYSVTLIEFFNIIDDAEKIINDAESLGLFDKLARARQYFAVSPCIVESMITDFRKSRGMDIPSFQKRSSNGNVVTEPELNVTKGAAAS